MIEFSRILKNGDFNIKKLNQDNKNNYIYRHVYAWFITEIVVYSLPTKSITYSDENGTIIILIPFQNECHFNKKNLFQNKRHFTFSI